MKHGIQHLLLTVLIVSSSAAALHAQYSIDRNVFGSGGTETKNAQNHIIGTLGQTCIGVTMNTNYTNHVGFWYGVDSAPVGITREEAQPESMKLGQNYPNPVIDATTIPFSVARSGFVRLSIVNIIGVEVQVLVDEDLRQGDYHVTFSAASLPIGLYFYRLQSTEHTITNTFVVRK